MLIAWRIRVSLPEPITSASFVTMFGLKIVCSHTFFTIVLFLTSYALLDISLLEINAGYVNIVVLSRRFQITAGASLDERCA